MKRKEYESPTTKIVMLKQRARLLAGSQLTGKRENAYGEENNVEGW